MHNDTNPRITRHTSATAGPRATSTSHKRNTHKQKRAQDSRQMPDGTHTVYSIDIDRRHTAHSTGTETTDKREAGGRPRPQKKKLRNLRPQALETRSVQTHTIDTWHTQREKTREGVEERAGPTGSALRASARPCPRHAGRSGPNLKPGTVCVCGISGLRNGMNTTPHPPSPASRAGTNLPKNVQAVSWDTHRPRFQVRARPS